jgi:hypothetical protein
MLGLWLLCKEENRICEITFVTKVSLHHLLFCCLPTLNSIVKSKLKLKFLVFIIAKC